MQHTKIEWCRGDDGKLGYTINPVKGLCPVACPYCYSRRMYKRFGWDEHIRYIGKQAFLDEVARIPRDGRKRIFVGSMMELFGDWINPEWLGEIFEVVKLFPFHTFIFLTKRPENLGWWRNLPGNYCHVGISATNAEEAHERVSYLAGIQAQVKFVSFEPLLGPPDGNYGQLDRIMEDIQWVIVGQQTPVRASTMPRKEWVVEIVEAADKAGVKVFLKDNLLSCGLSDYSELLDKNGHLRQELPE